MRCRGSEERKSTIVKNGPTQILPKQILVKDKILDLFGSKWISFVIWGFGGSFLDLFADAFLKAGFEQSTPRLQLQVT